MNLSNLRSDLVQIENLLGTVVTIAGLLEATVGGNSQLGLTIATVAAGLTAVRAALGDVLSGTASH